MDVLIKAGEVPQNWYGGIEKAKDKARRLLRKVIAVDQNTSVVIGRLAAVDIDKLWKSNVPYCRLLVNDSLRFRLDGKMEAKLGSEEVFFVNKPQMVMTVDEMEQRFPRIHDEFYKNWVKAFRD